MPPDNTTPSPLLQIRASAGSGKTYTLTHTFLRLLDGAKGAYGTPGCLLMDSGRNYALAEILAATFTNKAAAEMKARVLSGLKQRALTRMPPMTQPPKPLPVSSSADADAPTDALPHPQASPPMCAVAEQSNSLSQGLLLDNLPAKKAGRSAGKRNSGGSGAHDDTYRAVQIQEQDAVAERAAAWVDLILRRYGALNIRTIDSLLTTLVRLSALELGLSPDFTVSFDPEEYFTPIYDDLMDALAERGEELKRTDSIHLTPEATLGAAGQKDFPIPDSLAAKRLCRFAESAGAGGIGPLPGESEGLLAPQRGCRRVSIPSATDSLSPSEAAELRRHLRDACRALLFQNDGKSESKGFSAKNSLRDALFELTLRLSAGLELPRTPVEALHRELHKAHGGLVEAGKELSQHIQAEQLRAAKHFLSFLEKIPSGKAYEPLPKSAYAEKTHLDDCLNAPSRGRASDAALSAFRRFRSTMENFSRALRILLPALGLAPLSELARELHRRMQEHARTAGLLPLPAVPRLARQVLDGEYGVSDALCRLGSRLTHILLDEFQDTGNDQWQAVRPLVMESLSRGGTLTYVGDVKQAIYSWRGGETTLFESVRTDPELTAVAGRAAQIRLNDNWRSREAIIAHNNAFFSLPASESAARAVLAAMLPADIPETYLNAAVEQAVRIFSEVRQNVPDERGKGSADAPEGHAAAGGRVHLYTVHGRDNEEVRDLVQERLQRLLLHALFPHRAYGEVAVLVRTGAEGSLIASWLTRWGVPVVTENSFLLREHPLIGDLVALLTFLEYPLDDASFWEFLSGRECFGRVSGIPPAELNDWLAVCNRISETGRPPLFRLFRERFPDVWRLWLNPFFSQAGLMSAYDTISETIHRFALFDRSPEAAPFLRRFLEVAHLAETQGHSSLAAFLAFWKRAEDSEKIPLPESMNAVRIMTVHQAKGLEFPVVILPFHHGGRQREKTLHVTEWNGLPLLTRAGEALPEIYYPACITTELERLNLLYVAWTRPVDELHAFLTQPASSRNKPLSRGMEVLTHLYRETYGDAYCVWEDVGAAAQEEEREEEEQDAVQEDERGAAPSPAGGAASARESDFPGSPSVEQVVAAPSTLLTLPPADPLWRPMSRLPRLKVFRTAVHEVRDEMQDGIRDGRLPAPAQGSPERERRLSPDHRGILAHLCLEHLRLTRPKHAEARQEDVERAVRTAMRLFPLPIPQPEYTAEDMRACLVWFAALPEAAFWLRHGLREQSIMDAAGNIHRVDLLLDVPAGTSGPDGTPLREPCLNVLDYKTGRAPQADDAHQEQARRYMQLLSRIRNSPVGGVLVYLDERRLEEVHIERTHLPDKDVPA